jgi:hypothetical protein
MYWTGAGPKEAVRRLQEAEGRLAALREQNPDDV